MAQTRIAATIIADYTRLSPLSSSLRTHLDPMVLAGIRRVSTEASNGLP